MRLTIFAALAAAIAAAAAPQNAAAQGAKPTYADGENWLCLPGRADICSTTIRSTSLSADGWGKIQSSKIAADPAVDCFYVYPTISRDSGLNSDLTPGQSEELYVAQSQFARFSGVCRPFAPVYRQMTMAALAQAAIGVDMTAAGNIAYGDVRDAFRDYIENRNDGRPYVLIGHSQGSIMLERLIAEEVEGKPAADRLLRAYLPGWNLTLRAGETVGTKYASTPICTEAYQTRCIMSWVTYGPGERPPQGALFGYAANKGETVACTNPAQAGAKGWASLDGFYLVRSQYPVKGGPLRWSGDGPSPTAYATADNFVDARCVTDGQRGYLELRLPRGERDNRSNRIGGDVGMGGFFLAGWGKHLIDISIAQGDMMRQIERLSARAD